MKKLNTVLISEALTPDNIRDVSEDQGKKMADVSKKAGGSLSSKYAMSS